MQFNPKLLLVYHIYTFETFKIMIYNLINLRYLLLKNLKIIFIF